MLHHSAIRILTITEAHMTSKVITRFAPSPTGFLHIGGARTALFNWLFARANNGEMRLRIEDTDRARSTDAAMSAILDGLDWLGLKWDGDPVYQHKNASRHRQVAEELLAESKAYRCYCTAEELTAKREEASRTGGRTGYDRTCRDLHEEQEAPYTVRFKVPIGGETVIDDQVQGRVAIANNQLDDLVLLRSDGTPTYMLSVVVDDHDMEVTHIIRGDDHLTNAAKQSLIYQALGWEIPVFAHIPLIHGPDGAKLSKRHGALGVEAYRAMGYLPEALRNYLVRLGWSHGDDEIISTSQMIEWFGLNAINRAPARFDFAKLESVNAHYMRQMPAAELLQQLLTAMPYLDGGPERLSQMKEAHEDSLLKALPGLQERAATLQALLDASGFLFANRPIPMDAKASKFLSDEGRERLGALVPALERIEGWSKENIEAAIRSHMEASGLKLGNLAQPLRGALTGSAVSPGIFDVLFALGKDESLARINDQVMN